MKTDPLNALISNDARATDRQKLADLLTPYVVIDQKSQEFGFKEAFEELDNDTKIEIFLASIKARALLFGVTDGSRPTELISLGIMPEGSVKTSLKRLFENRKIKKGNDGNYFLPAYRILELSKRLVTKQPK